VLKRKTMTELEVEKTSPKATDKPADKGESSKSAEEVVIQGLKDAQCSKIVNVLGYVVIVAILLYYTITQWIFYANTSENRQTSVTFAAIDQMTFPAIVFEITDVGIIQNLSIFVFDNACKITNLSNHKNINYTSIHNPKTVSQSSKEWLILNTSLAYYGFSGYGFNFTYNDTGSRRLFSSYPTEQPNTTEFAYSYNDYYSSSASNIYYVLPPNKPSPFTVTTNHPQKCGDVFVVYIETVAAVDAFSNYTSSDPLLLSLYARSYPDSYGIQIAYDSRDAVVESLSAKNHFYFTSRIGFGQTFADTIQLTISNDEVDSDYETLYAVISSLDYTNKDVSPVRIIDNNAYFDNFLFIYGNNFQTTYTTSQLYSWLDIFSNIGGFYASIAGPVAFFIAIWLYGTSIGCWEYKGRAPLDPLPDDMVKRLDVYIASKVVDKVLAAGSNPLQTETE